MTEVLEQEVVEDRLGDVPIVLDTRGLKLSDDQFFQFCVRNPEWRIEREPDGRLSIMSPVEPMGSSGNAALTHFFVAWAIKDGTGRVFDSSGGFILRNKAVRSPDVAWIRNERLKRLPAKDLKGFLALVPDFVLELRSRSDRMPVLHAKMEEYIASGARLGSLLDSVHKEVFIYRPGEEAEKLTHPKEISGENVLKGFVLDVREVWAAMNW